MNLITRLHNKWREITRNTVEKIFHKFFNFVAKFGKSQGLNYWHISQSQGSRSKTPLPLCRFGWEASAGRGPTHSSCSSVSSSPTSKFRFSCDIIYLLYIFKTHKNNNVIEVNQVDSFASVLQLNSLVIAIWRQYLLPLAICWATVSGSTCRLHKGVSTMTVLKNVE